MADAARFLSRYDTAPRQSADNGGALDNDDDDPYDPYEDNLAPGPGYAWSERSPSPLPDDGRDRRERQSVAESVPAPAAPAAPADDDLPIEAIDTL